MPPTAALSETVLQRPLADVVQSPRALKALEAAGLKTLGDVAAKGLGTLQGLRHVGEATRVLIERALGPLPATEEDDDEIEEGAHPLHLESPIRSMRIALLATHRHVTGNGVTTLDRPLYIEFDDGSATLSKQAWLMRVYERDAVKVAEGMGNPGLPWRKAAAAWLRSLDTHTRGEFRVLGD